MRYRTWMLSIVAVLASGGAAGDELRNQLADHPSAYLELHADDPVQWQEWGQAAVERARSEDKLLFVSSGYFACHWCHVMQRESFKDDAIAAFINRHYIPVKIDREIEAALDGLLIDFVRRTRGYAGWPLNVFITPEGHPLVGLVYMPPEDFAKLLEGLAGAWHEDRASLREEARVAAESLAAPQPPGDAEIPVGLGRSLQARLAEHARQLGDDMEGGLGDQSKFPNSPQLKGLLDLYAASGDAQLEDFLRLTLDQMAEQGLRDHLGGGFFRYTEDPSWQVPHFEKMLYDNAMLASVYLRAARELEEPRYEAVARETLDFMLRDLRVANGGFASALSALDDQDVEGGYYLWDRRELEDLLPPEEFAVVALVWGLDRPPQFEHGHHLTRALSDEAAAARLELDQDELRRHLASARERMLERRAQRVLPRDDKVITAWNALALSALARAAELPDGKVYREAGERVRAVLVERLWDDEQGRLWRAARGERTLGEGALEDYALAAAAFYDWAQVSGRAADYALAERVVREAWRRFYDGGWHLAEHTLLRYGVAQTLLSDEHLPSPSAAVLGTTLRLAERLDDTALRTQALAALNVGHRALEDEPLWFVGHIRLLAALEPPASARAAEPVSAATDSMR
ncbi:thioredoxin domain-containing protein [Ectothiorhodospiraceae bacterium 2226]|nr:thioredoxin domain-containing protein [Ectothiorhodospiraceae bacterium 2226]